MSVVTAFATECERQRLVLQASLDAQKTSEERNQLGQYATPTRLASEVIKMGLRLLPSGEKIDFLDPAIGTGSFYSALQEIAPKGQLRTATGFEIDPHYGLPAQKLWESTALAYLFADFTRQPAKPQCNLLICNPPYVRHHHLEPSEKVRLQSETQRRSGMKLSGLAGLYCHFLGLAHAWMKPNGIAGWLIPSEFMDVNYGQAVKDYLLTRVTLLHIHRFDPKDVQFADALVSSAVVWFKNTPPKPNDHETIEFSFGGSLLKPRLTRRIPSEVLRVEHKWSRFPREEARKAHGYTTLGDLFQIKRGIATGSNEFFILPALEAETRRLPREQLRPILPSPRYISGDEIEADDNGEPRLDRKLYLLDIDLPEATIRKDYPTLWAYLEEGRQRGVCEGYICRHRQRWYAQDHRPPAPIVCTYLGRGSKQNRRPFRFIRNRSQATVANVYLAMYPKSAFRRAIQTSPSLLDEVWQELNKIELAQLLGEGRVYGGGLHKLEPKELGKVPIAFAGFANLAIGKSDDTKPTLTMSGLFD